MEPTPRAETVEVRYYPRDGSVFLDTHYLVKGVAGALFWKLAREHTGRQRSEFSLRELRLAGHELRLPEVQDNLSVRLLLLQRRLTERAAVMQIHRIGRGRFRIEVSRPLLLIEVPDPACAARAVPPGREWLHRTPWNAEPCSIASLSLSASASMSKAPGSAG